MSFSLSGDDLKERLLNVFGSFLNNLGLYPVNKLEPGMTAESTPLTAISAEHKRNCLGAVSINKIQRRLKKDSFEGNIQEAF